MPEYALDAIMARVEEEHEVKGDGSFVQDEANAKALEELPACRNDGELAATAAEGLPEGSRLLEGGQQSLCLKHI